MLNKVFEPKIAINREITYYHNKVYTNDYIKRGFTRILNRFKLIDI